jgi:hypothetical protein
LRLAIVGYGEVNVTISVFTDDSRYHIAVVWGFQDGWFRSLFYRCRWLDSFEDGFFCAWHMRGVYHLLYCLHMPTFKIMRGTAQGKTWKAVGTNPSTGKQMTIQGGQKGTAVGPKARGTATAKAFDARHNATGMTPKKYVNKLRWDGKAAIGSSVVIPSKLFKK